MLVIGLKQAGEDNLHANGQYSENHPVTPFFAAFVAPFAG
jgi:hypothetical protein